MATKSVSPGGALLRASRMFAIPAPLQRPASELASVVTFNSDTATLPHPVELSVSTPPSSRSKGDWGFKRNLPLRSTTKSSTPIIRVSSVDTLEHITEFASAADHTLTLRKWQELNMPLTTPSKSKRGHFESVAKSAGRGVFEEDQDFTSVEGQDAHKDMRWKFQGPWLAGQTEGEFNYYIKKDIAAKRPAFRRYIQQYKAEQDTKAAQRKALDAGEEAPAPVKATDISEEEMTQYIRALRQDRTELFRLIRDFLDLPPAPSYDVTIEDVAEQIFSQAASGSLGTKTRSDYIPQQESNSPYANTGPPKTHPSAGLSYLRSNAYISNHPIYGPQAEPTPVEGRVIMPKNAAVGSFAPKLGVAGVVTDVPSTADFYTSGGSHRRGGRFATDKVPGLINIEPDVVGGSKVMLKPRMASIDPKGRIILSVDNARPAAIQVAQGTVTAPATQTPVDIALNQAKNNTATRPAGTGSYGLSAGSAANPWAQSGAPKTAGREYKQLESLLDDLPKKN